MDASNRGVHRRCHLYVSRVSAGEIARGWARLDRDAVADRVGGECALYERDWISVLHRPRSASPIDYVLEFGHFVGRELEICFDRLDYNDRGIGPGAALRKAAQRADDRRRRSYLPRRQREPPEVDHSFDQCGDRGGRHSLHWRD